VEARRRIILDAVDTFIRIHDQWEADMSAPPQPSERFERSLKLAVEVCERGDTPQDCRRLVASVAKMGIEWLRYESGVHRSGPDGDVLPVKAFWDAVRVMKQERTGSAPVRPKSRESVALLRKQGLNDRQIAVCWADPEWPNGYGPLFGSRGEPDCDAIEREANQQNSVLPADYVHYDDRVKIRNDEETLRTRLSELQQETEASQLGRDSNEDPEQMLRDGAYLNQVAMVCGMTLDEVVDLANRMGIKAEQTPNLASERAPHEPAIDPHAAAAMDATVREDDEPDSVETPEMQVRRLSDQGSTPEEIAERLGLTVKAVRRMMRSGVGA
jgi:hypothetical protein